VRPEVAGANNVDWHISSGKTAADAFIESFTAACATSCSTEEIFEHLMMSGSGFWRYDLQTRQTAHPLRKTKPPS